MAKKQNGEKIPTEAEIERQIRVEMAGIRRKMPTREKLEAEFHKYDCIYRASVLECGATVMPYIWREVYRRLLDETDT